MSNRLSEKTCVFCGRELSGTKSREHVIPKWLLAELGLELETFYQQVVRKSDEEVLNERAHAASAFVLGSVCTSCNTGWMSELEARAKPLLVSLIRGERTALGLIGEERALLAFWVCKTAYVMSHAGLHNKPVPSGHFRNLAQHSLPPTGVGVFAGSHTHTGTASVFQTGDWPHLHLEPQRGIPIEKEEGYKLGLQFKDLLLLVSHSPDARGLFVLATAVHVPVWPIEHIYPSYSCGKEMSELQDSRATLGWFCATLGVLHPPPEPSPIWTPSGARR